MHQSNNLETTVTFSARFPADVAEQIKGLQARHGLRSGIVTQLLVEGARMKLAAMQRTTEGAGASLAAEMS